MSYEPTVWQTGDVVTSAKLNKLENGVANAGGGVLIVHVTDGVLDKTWKELDDAVFSVLDDRAGNGLLWSTGTYGEDGYYSIGYYGIALQDAIIYHTNSENGYPVYEDTPG